MTQLTGKMSIKRAQTERANKIVVRINKFLR